MLPSNYFLPFLIRSMAMVKDQTHKVIKSSCHTFRFRKVQAQSSSGFTNSSSGYTCNGCFPSKLLALYDKLVFVCYRVLNTGLVTEASSQDLNVSTTTATTLLYDLRWSQVKLFMNHCAMYAPRLCQGKGGRGFSCHCTAVTPVCM